MIYHYWYHTGENMAIRQALGHTALADDGLGESLLPFGGQFR